MARPSKVCRDTCDHDAIFRRAPETTPVPRQHAVRRIAADHDLLQALAS